MVFFGEKKEDVQVKKEVKYVVISLAREKVERKKKDKPSPLSPPFGWGGTQ